MMLITLRVRLVRQASSSEWVGGYHLDGIATTYLSTLYLHGSPHKKSSLTLATIDKRSHGTGFLRLSRRNLRVSVRV